MSDYKVVSGAEFERYPGTKRSGGTGARMAYEVKVDEQRPIDEEERALADRLHEVFQELGLTEMLARGGLDAARATTRIASAVVATVDESLPQYARAAVLSLAREVAGKAGKASDWAVNADRSDETLLQRKECAAPRLG